MINSHSFVVALAMLGVVLLGVGRESSAQGSQTGVIRGTVVDQQHAPVAFVTVTAQSPAMQGRRTATTASDGTYVLGQLPPAEYELTFDAPRYTAGKRVVTVFIGAVVDLYVTMQDRGSADVEDGVRQTPTPARAIATYFTREEIDRLPIPRTLPAIADLAPGVTVPPTAGAGQVSVHGGFLFDNVFLLNGADITDNLFGSPQDLFIEGAIAQTAIMRSRLPAEYGRFTGGVVNAVTSSGGDRFNGGYRVDLSNPSWTSETPLDRCDARVVASGCRKAPPRADTLHALQEATLGGYIVKSRVWFFSAGRLSRQDHTSALPVTAAPDRESTSDRRGELKLTGTIATGHSLTVDATGNRTDYTNRAAFEHTIDPAALGNRRVANYYHVASYRAAIGRKALVEGQFSRRRFERQDISSASTAIVDSPIFAQTIAVAGSPVHYNAPYFDANDPEQRNSVQGGGTLSYFINTATAGHHEVNGGYEFFRNERIGGNSQSPTGYVFDTNYLTGAQGAPVLDTNGRFIPLWIPGRTLMETWLPARGAALNVDSQTLHLQDHWAINSRWSADVGARYERARGKATGTFTRLRSDTLLPRFAAAYNIDGAGTHVVQASYGSYTSRYDEALLGANSGVAHPDQFVGVYVGQVGQGRIFAPGFEPANYLTLSGRFPTANVSVDSGLMSPRMNEFTTSYAVSLMNGRGSAQTAFVSREWSRFIEDYVSIANGTSHVVRRGFDVGTFTNVLYRNTDDAVRKYAALEFQSRFRLLARLTANGTYTLQLRNEGTYAAEGADGAPATSPLGDYPEIFNRQRHYPDGRLAEFQRHKVRFWSTYDMDYGRAGSLSVAALVRAESGRPYSIVTTNQPLTALQRMTLVAAGYPDAPPTQTIFFGGRGSQTFKGYGLLDIALRYQIPTVSSLKPWVKIDVFNALNNQKQIAWDTTVSDDETSAVDALGLHTGFRPAPTFGKALSNNAFPTPAIGETGGRTFHVAAGFSF